MVFFSLLPYTTIFDAIATSRKGALYTPDLTEKRTLWPAHTQNALFRDVARPECAFP